MLTPVATGTYNEHEVFLNGKALRLQST